MITIQIGNLAGYRDFRNLQIWFLLFCDSMKRLELALISYNFFCFLAKDLLCELHLYLKIRQNQNYSLCFCLVDTHKD